MIGPTLQHRRYLLVMLEADLTTPLGIVVPAGAYRVLSHRKLLTDTEPLYLVEKIGGQTRYSVAARHFKTVGRTD